MTDKIEKKRKPINISRFVEKEKKERVRERCVNEDASFGS